MENSPTIFIVPTGIGCEVGGFAGDALPTAKLLASASGCLITHPNVMNGGTLSEKDKNIFYVEGYSLDRLAKGEIGLKRVKQQKIGIIFDSAIEKEILVRHLQVADACVSTLGINIHSYVITKKPLNIVIDPDSSKISGGTIEKSDSEKLPSDIVFEQSPDQLLDSLLPLYLQNQVLRALQESAASELACRMTAMNNASDNAKELASTLNLTYNKARQAAITQEILEVVGGSAV